MTIEQAKEVLKENGYYVDNLWHIDDVKNTVIYQMKRRMIY